MRTPQQKSLFGALAAVVLIAQGCGVETEEVGGQQAGQAMGGEIQPLALGGPVILGGDDLNDHGSYNTSTRQLQLGWLYIGKALENIKIRVARTHDNTVAVLG